ncbi:MAG: diacylglycerol kinase family protein [Cyanobacteria bacterium KgW148]|nr:diacylglycerol kinase family protein [Cyanobacteria bacterium KgW148]
MDEPLQRPPSFSVADSVFASFRFAWAGICYTFVTQRNFRIQCTIGIIAISLSFLVHLAALKFLCVCLTIVLVLALELLNTAIEAVVDLTIGKNFHPLAKVAKDCSAGAVLVSAIGSIVVAVILLLPPLSEKFGVQIPSVL